MWPVHPDGKGKAPGTPVNLSQSFFASYDTNEISTYIIFLLHSSLPPTTLRTRSVSSAKLLGGKFHMNEYVTDAAELMNVLQYPGTISGSHY